MVRSKFQYYSVSLRYAGTKRDALMFVCFLYKSMFPTTVLSVKSDSGVTFCLQSYQGLRIDRSLVY